MERAQPFGQQSGQQASENGTGWKRAEQMQRGHHNSGRDNLTEGGGEGGQKDRSWLDIPLEKESQQRTAVKPVLASQ